AALAPDWPWSMSMTVICSSAQPSAIARERRSYWRCADSVWWMTCLRVDWRTYSSAGLARCAVVTLDAAVSVNTGTGSFHDQYACGAVGFGDGQQRRGRAGCLRG